MGGFFYVVNDDSMSGDRIHTGDRLFIKDTVVIQENEISAIAEETDVSLLKFRRVIKQNNGFLLVPSNPKFEVEFKNNLLVVGRVTTVYKNT